MVLFQKDYVGFEALADIERDVTEALDSAYNPYEAASILEGEYQGTLRVTITWNKRTS
jgi:hypothetical protein